ncbi:hypothetical protein J2T58_002192 [Methanocalculus alkaliphilus]|uniref:CDP-glycerol glycerophosphotransferase family protein n=1 Tax=Methanocalculus alkaliphilus TaxID=768730 RepID=UPI0020A1406A|nr:CDP-glycerol glycerophosphotransferase family protein [Methanocalculus alkaliphilus]MCP1716316.1 hypothetical protein [Methanocalculus alkaliphilus]
MLINRIGFFLIDPRQIDYYNNIFKNLERDEFEIIVNDLASSNEKNEILKYISDYGYNFKNLSDLLRSKQKYKIVVGTGNFTIRSQERNLFSDIKYFSIRLYSRSIGLLLDRSRVSKLLLRYFKRPVALGESAKKVHYRREIYPEKAVSKKCVCFPRGMDISEDHPGTSRTESFDYFFCHGELDYTTISKKTNKPAFIIGYPRYDDIFDVSNNFYNELVDEFQLDRKKELIYWMPSRVDWQEKPDGNILLWAPELSKLQERYNIICRPHPHRTRDNPLLVQKLKEYGFFVDIKSSRNLTQIYSASDYIFADYGGSIFSAIYCGCKLVLLNLPEQNKYVGKGLDFVMRDYLPNFNLLDYDNNKISTTLFHNNCQIWNRHDVEQKKLREYIFGCSLKTPGSIIVCNKLRELLMDN